MKEGLESKFALLAKSKKEDPYNFFPQNPMSFPKKTKGMGIKICSSLRLLTSFFRIALKNKLFGLNLSFHYQFPPCVTIFLFLSNFPFHRKKEDRYRQILLTIPAFNLQ